MFKLGEIVTHPLYGLCTIKDIRDKNRKPILVIKPKRPLPGDFKLLVDGKKAKISGIRYPITKKEISSILEILSGEPSNKVETEDDVTTLNEKIRSGNPYKMAEAIRDLSKRKRKLSPSGTKDFMLETTRNLLVEEIAFVEKKSKKSAHETIEDSLMKNN